MLVYVFEGPMGVYGFTEDPLGDNLPEADGPWKPFKQMDMNSGEPRLMELMPIRY
jgi:hypothetical protein